MENESTRKDEQRQAEADMVSSMRVLLARMPNNNGGMMEAMKKQIFSSLKERGIPYSLSSLVAMLEGMILLEATSLKVKLAGLDEYIGKNDTLGISAIVAGVLMVIIDDLKKERDDRMKDVDPSSTPVDK